MIAPIDLSAVSTADLEGELQGRKDGDLCLVQESETLDGALDDDIREAAVDRGFLVYEEGDGPFEDIDEARALLNRGNLRECLYAIEKQLPHEFFGLTERVFAAAATKPMKAAPPDLGRLPKRVQSIIDTVRHGQTLCCHKHLNRDGNTERMWFFEPSGKPATPKSAEAAVATSFLVPCGDGLFPNMAQTWRAAP